MRPVIRLLSLLAAAFILASCSSNQQQIDLAEAQIARFRELMAAREYQQIYDEGAPVLKQSATAKAMIDLLRNVQQGRGAFKSAERSGWRVAFNISKSIRVTLVFAAQFEKGPTTETFVYDIIDGKPLLAGYHINYSLPQNKEALPDERRS